MSSVITNKQKSSDSDDIDLGRIVGELIDHRKLIVAITSAFMVVSVAYSFFATPIYQADALIQVEQKQANAILSNLSQLMPDEQPQSAPEIALLQSRMILGKTVDDENLQALVQQKYFPIFGRGLSRLMGNTAGHLTVSRLYLPGSGKADEYPEVTLTVLDRNEFLVEGKDKTGEEFSLKGKVGHLFSEKGISLIVDDIQADVGTTFKVKYLTRLKAINDLAEDFTVVDQGKDSGMLNLSLTGENSAEVAKVLDTISRNYLDQNISRQAAQDEKSFSFLQKQLPEVRAELDSAEDKLNTYRKQRDTVDLTMEAKTVLDQIVNLDNQINELTFREAEISQLYTKTHPTYKALLEKRKTLTDEKERISKRVSEMPATQQEVLRLSRDVESGRAVYMMLLNRQQELNIAKSSAIGNVRIVDNAVTEPKPVEPRKLLIILIGSLIGGFISVGVVLLRTLLRRGIESPEQLEELGISVYSSVPVSEWVSKKSTTGKLVKNGKHDETSFLSIDNPTDLAIEAIRSLRTSLHFAMMEAKNNVLMISGASPNAGKTFISSNLAAIISQTGKRVLFIDTDMRKGYAHKLFQLSNDKGLSDILSGMCSLEDSIKTVPSAGFDFISRGKAPPNPAELLMNPRFDSLIEEVSHKYDMVIIDTPPILAVTDPAVIGRTAGTVLLVARFEMNTVKEIEVSIKRFEQSGVNVRGCILNGVVKKASSYYSYGYTHYGYNYSEKDKD